MPLGELVTVPLPERLKVRVKFSASVVPQISLVYAELPAVLNALTRQQYVVLLAKFASVYVLTLDETLATRAKVPLVPVLRSTPNPSSLSEASVQLSVS